MALPKSQQTKLLFVVKFLIHAICLFLLFNLYYQAINDNLGADPVEAVLHFTGIGAFNLLLLSLFITPLAKYAKQSLLLKFRRLLGLYSFSYAIFHLASFLAFEVQFDWELFIDEIIDRPYITVGMLALVILFSLAVTSVSSLKRKMGKSWQKLHNGVYLAVILVSLHFYWSVKSEIIEPSIYIAITLTLLFLRKQKIKRFFKKH